jgi:hypothetical protein
MRQVTRPISREVVSSLSHGARLTPQRLHAELLAVSALGSRAYLLGALHDATISNRHRTVRFGQSDARWLEVLRVLLEKLGQNSWVYREGRSRNFWVLETSDRWLEGGEPLISEEEKLAYARGYFDTEGGIPRSPGARFYIQFVQKDHSDLSELRDHLMGMGIACGKLHVPSARQAPDLWRFYVRARSHRTFVERVGSWHPRKRNQLDVWLQASNQDGDIVRASWRHGE